MKTNSKIFHYCTGVSLLLMASAGYAQTIKIAPNTVISSPTTYENVTLDLSNGSFIIKKGTSLTIKNSVLNGTLSKDIPVLISVENGNLNMDSTQVNVKTQNLPQHPKAQSLEYVVQVGQGGVNLNGNQFKIDQPYTAGLLITTSTLPTTGIQVTHNKFEQFHGVLYLIVSDNALVSDNTFRRNSYGQIVMVGNNNKIIHNTIFFSGNYKLGNSIDILDSDNVTISKNSIFTPTCHAIYVLNSSNMVIDGNRISGGITYAMNVLTYPETMKEDDRYLLGIKNGYTAPAKISNNITISNNYMSQNRYGVAVSDADTVTLKNNVFVQRFEDKASRKFWTDNGVLLQNVTHLNWTNNLYKEAYTQAINGNNSNSSKFYTFPQSGGVVLP